VLQKWLLVDSCVERMACEGVIRRVVWVAVAGASMTSMEDSHWALNENTKCYVLKFKDQDKPSEREEERELF